MRIDQARNQHPIAAIDDVDIGDILADGDEGFDAIAAHEHVAPFDQRIGKAIEHPDIRKQDRPFTVLREGRGGGERTGRSRPEDGLQHRAPVDALHQPLVQPDHLRRVARAACVVNKVLVFGAGAHFFLPML